MLKSKPDRSSIDAEGWFDTGDIAFVDDKNRIFVRGRENCTFNYCSSCVCYNFKTDVGSD